jgi:hypothetical protein
MDIILHLHEKLNGRRAAIRQIDYGDESPQTPQ